MRAKGRGRQSARLIMNFQKGSPAKLAADLKGFLREAVGHGMPQFMHVRSAVFLHKVETRPTPLHLDPLDQYASV